MDKDLAMLMLWVDIVIMLLLAIDVYISYKNSLMLQGSK